MGTQVVGPKSLGALNDTVELIEGGPALVHTMIVQGTFVGSIVLEGSADGQTWFGLKIQQASTAGTVAGDVVTAVGIYAMSTFTPLARVRARMSAYTSGAALVQVVSGG